MRVVAFPSDDQEFGTLVQRTFDALEARSPAALEVAISRLYPMVSVQPRHPLAEFSETHTDETWYVFRDGVLATEQDPGQSEGSLGLETT
jgi:hypothetical protein